MVGFSLGRHRPYANDPAPGRRGHGTAAQAISREFRRLSFAKGLDLFDAAHVAAGPLAERLISVMGPGEAEQLKDLLTRFTSSAED